jgi:4-hydroxyproline epimerase
MLEAPVRRSTLRRVRVIDSHTEGEPTRVVLSGGPDLGEGTLEERLRRFRGRFDHFRRAVVGEPRGADPIVGALLCTPDYGASAAGVLFFNNIGYLGMCGHGTIGLVATLAHLGRWGSGRRAIDTPVGPVLAEYHGGGRASFWNVPSFRTRSRVTVEVPGYSRVTGDVAWGGNWFFVINRTPLELRPENAPALTQYCKAIESALARHKITGTSGEKIEHIELCGPPMNRINHGRNFVLCPGGAYDRSPCGTGTSAKMACLVADHELAPGEPWRQEGILGGVFEGRAEPVPDGIRPRITGNAYLTGEGDLLFDEQDPFRHGVPPR